MAPGSTWTAPPSEFLVPFDGTFRVADAPTAPLRQVEETLLKEQQAEHTLAIRDLQRKLYADDRYAIWSERFESIRSFEKHLADNGTIVVKFFLNVSFIEQKQRFLRRIDNPSKNWKFSLGDVAERERWGDYMHAFEEALNATSRPWAPWYAIPADSKPYMRLQVARIVHDTLLSLGVEFPRIDDAARL